MKNEKGIKFLDLEGKVVKIEDIKDGLWIKAPGGRLHELHGTIPRECDECGFPAMEILSKNFKNHRLTIGCPWCNVLRVLCLVCGKMEHGLGNHPHKN